MSDTNNTTTTPAAPAAPAQSTTATPQQGVPQNLVSLDAIWRKTVAEPAEARIRGETPPDSAQTQPEPAKTTEQKPVEQAKTPDRRFKLTPQKSDEAKQEPPKQAEQPPASDHAEADELLKIELPKGSSEGQQKNWQRARSALESYKATVSAKDKELAELRSKLEISTKTTANPPTADYEAAKAQVKELSERLARVDYANSPEFLAKYKVPQDSALAEAQEVLTYNDKKADLRTLLGKSPKELNAALADVTKGMNSVDQATVINAVRQAAKLESGAQEALKNAKANVENQQQRVLYQNRASFDQTWSRNNTAQSLQKHEIPTDIDPQSKAYLEAYNAGVDSIRTTAEKYAFTPLSPDDTALVAQKAATCDFYEKHGIPAMDRFLNSLAAERDALAAENKALKAARNPGIPTGDNSGSGQTKATSLEDLWNQTVASKRS